MTLPRPLPVSFNDEPLILVDSNDTERGFVDKREAHQGSGMLHRAFSIFLFDGPNRVLLQQRSQEKPLWPGYWSNSCCSHPRQGETYDTATVRRLREELGATATLHALYRFEYHAQFGTIGAEHELCTVYVGNAADTRSITVHQDEVMAWDWFDCAEVDQWSRHQPDVFTPWFLMEWHALRGRYRADVERVLNPSG